MASSLGIKIDREGNFNRVLQVEEVLSLILERFYIQVRSSKKIFGEENLVRRRKFDDKSWLRADENALLNAQLEDDSPLFSSGQPSWIDGTFDFQ